MVTYILGFPEVAIINHHFSQHSPMRILYLLNLTEDPNVTPETLKTLYHVTLAKEFLTNLKGYKLLSLINK